MVKFNKISEICAVVNIYRRTHLFDSQISSILSQTIKPKEIFIWINHHEDNVDFVENEMMKILDSYDFDNFKIFNNSENWKFHGRFTCPLLSNCEYINVFDDDTIPGSKWLEKCVDLILHKNCLIGTIGELFEFNGENVQYIESVGWRTQNEKPTEVDIVGHSWFFKKDWLKYFWAEDLISKKTGEDIHFSNVLQREGIKSFVLDHPKSKKEEWGSKDGELGEDDVASYIQFNWEWRDPKGARQHVLNESYKKGWKLINS